MDEEEENKDDDQDLAEDTDQEQADDQAEEQEMEPRGVKPRKGSGKKWTDDDETDDIGQVHKTVVPANWREKCKEDDDWCKRFYTSMNGEGRLRELCAGHHPPRLTEAQRQAAVDPCIAKYGVYFEKGFDEGFDCWAYNDVKLKVANCDRRLRGERAANEGEGESESESTDLVLIFGVASLLSVLLAALCFCVYAFRKQKETKGSKFAGKSRISSRKGCDKQSRKGTLPSKCAKSRRSKFRS